MTRREKDDFYPTPPEMVESLLSREFSFPLNIHEPACGDGAISKVLESHGHKVYSFDLIDRGFGSAGIDFLLETAKPCDFLITNPPYKLAQQFVIKAIDLGYKKHAWLLRLAFLEGQKRYESLFCKHPFDICYVFSRRRTIWRGDEEKNGCGTIPYAWFIWSEDSSRQRIEWL